MKKEDYKVLCTCGHMLEEHHLSYFMDGSSRVLGEECEFYGFNESGGMMYNEEGQWVDHCYRFIPIKEENNE